jgi:hypothetical protein
MKIVFVCNGDIQEALGGCIKASLGNTEIW